MHLLDSLLDSPNFLENWIELCCFATNLLSQASKIMESKYPLFIYHEISGVKNEISATYAAILISVSMLARCKLVLTVTLNMLCAYIISPLYSCPTNLIEEAADFN